MKTLTSPEVVAGSPISYDIALTNQGPSVAADVHSYDPIPREITDPVGKPDPSIPGATCATRPTEQSDLDRLEPAYGPYSFTSHPLVVECTYPAFPPATTVHDTISGTVDPAVAAGTNVVNQAVAYSTTYDPVFSDNLSAAPAAVKARADLAITKAVDETKVQVGDEATFTVTVRNNGPSVATDVVVTDVPTGMRARTSAPSHGSFARGSWKVGSLGVGEKATLTATYTITGEQALNTATAASAVSDEASTDNEARVVLAVLPPTGGGNGHDHLPDTGNPVNQGMLRLALALLVVGGFAVAFGRRRRTS